MKTKLARRASLLLVTSAFLQCRTNPIVNFSVVLPSNDGVAWIEVAAYPGASCNALVALSESGLPAEGASMRAIWKPGEAAPPLGDLPKRDYAFVATAKGANCEVVAVGCSSADTSDARDITVTLGTAPNRLGACGERQTCSMARCVPQPSGAGCTLNTVGEGPLGSVPTLSAQPIPSPAIVALGDNFLVASAEFASDGPSGADASSGEARTFITTQLVDGAGGSKLGSQGGLGSRCANLPQTDGIGLTYLADEASEGSAFVLLGRNQCDGNAGVDVVNVAANSALVSGSASRFGVAPGNVLVAKAHSTVPRIAGKFVGAYSRDTATIVLPMTKTGDTTQADPAVQSAPPTTVPPVLAATSKLLALITKGPQVSGDAGGLPGLAVSTTTLSGTASIPAFSNTRSLAGTWATAIAADEKIFALAGDATKLSIWQIGAKASDDKLVIELLVDTEVPFADLAYITSDGDAPLSRIVVAYQNAGGFVFRVVDLGGDPAVEAQTVKYHPTRLLPPKGARDHHFAIAATKSRIGLTWATAAQLSEGEPVGGYAVFSCER
ncbi:MAG: hypothetical protein U0174_05155 [Polyangiaceae bacterium]